MDLVLPKPSHVVFDPQFGTHLLHESLDILHGRRRERRVHVEGRDAPARTTRPEVVEVTREKHGDLWDFVRIRNKYKVVDSPFETPAM